MRRLLGITVGAGLLAVAVASFDAGLWTQAMDWIIDRIGR